MTQQWNDPARPQGGPPPGGPPAGNGPARRGGGLWWVIIAVAAVVLVALVVWGVFGQGGDPDPDTTPTASVTTTEPDPSDSSTPETTAPESTGPEDPGIDWGPYPPPNVDSRRDLSAANFPETVGSFTLSSSSQGAASANASYEDLSQAQSFTVFLSFSATRYEGFVSEYESPTQIGDAICGTRTSETTGMEHTDCVMAGQNETLQVVNVMVPLEEIGELTQELYDSM